MEELTLAQLDLAGASDPARAWDKERTEARVSYAWNWFQYHANQRMQAFNFFLIIVAVLTSGYLTAFDREIPLMQIVIGLVGIVISYAFVALDFRNAQLVSDARFALVHLECALELEIHRTDYSRPITLSRSQLLFGCDWPVRLSPLPLVGRPFAKHVPMRHTVHLRRIERFAIFLFLCGTIVGIANAFQDNRETINRLLTTERQGSTAVIAAPKQ